MKNENVRYIVDQLMLMLDRPSDFAVLFDLHYRRLVKEFEHSGNGYAATALDSIYNLLSRNRYPDRGEIELHLMRMSQQGG